MSGVDLYLNIENGGISYIFSDKELYQNRTKDIWIIRVFKIILYDNFHIG